MADFARDLRGRWRDMLGEFETFLLDERVRKCSERRSDVPALASRCAFCTAQIPAAAGGGRAG